MELTDILELVPCVQIVGAKNQGKTTLIKNIIPILKQKGLSILTFKHSSHVHPIDKPDSDSDIFRKAGADLSAFQSGDGIGLYFHPDNIQLANTALLTMVKHMDLVIVESFSTLPGPKILLHRNRLPRQLPENIIAVVGDEVPQLPSQILLPLDYHIISEFICSTFNLNSSTRV